MLEIQSAKDITFIKETHTYLFNGKELKSCTQLLSEVGISPSYEKVNEELLNQARERGEQVHKEIEDYSKLGINTESHELTNFIKFLYENNYEVVGSEVIVHNDDYAGTIDLILLDITNDKYIIADIKTTSVIHTESVSWQNSIYIYLSQLPIIKSLCIHFDKEGEIDVEELEIKSEFNVKTLLENKALPLVKISQEQVRVVTTALRQIKECEDAISVYNQYVNQFKDTILVAMEENDVKSFENEDFRLVRVLATTKSKVDLAKLKKDYPEIYEKCLIKTTTKASVRITLKEKEEHGEEE